MQNGGDTSSQHCKQCFEKLQLSVFLSNKQRNIYRLLCYDRYLTSFTYVQSVTEEEVKNGILYNPNAARQSLFFDREYTNIDMSDNAAPKFIDIKGANFLYLFILFLYCYFLRRQRRYRCY